MKKSRKLLIEIAMICIAITWATNASAVVIIIDPGAVGTTYPGIEIGFTDLNGTIANGQTITVDFLFPRGIDAVYRYDDTTIRELYGWHAGLHFVGGTTITVEPGGGYNTPLDENGDPFGNPVGWAGLYNADSFGVNVNYNMTYSPDNLIGFTDVPYHGVRITLRLPDYLEDNVIVSSGSFGFRANGSGEYTEIISAVPIPAALWLFGSGLLGLVGIARRRKAA